MQPHTPDSRCESVGGGQIELVNERVNTASATTTSSPLKYSALEVDEEEDLGVVWVKKWESPKRNESV